LFVPLLALGVATTVLACGVAIRRDYSAIPPGQVGFDDMCGLQDYFDSIEAHLETEPPIVNAVDIEGSAGKPVRGGKNLFRFETPFQLKQLRRTLDENWKRLPEELAGAKAVELEVHWSERSGVRRVVTDSDAELIINRESFALPYQVCLSELLYGAPLYHQRRELTGRALPVRPLLDDATMARIEAAHGNGDADGGSASPIARFLPAPTTDRRADAGAPGAPTARQDAGAPPPPPPAAPVFRAAPPAQ
jgi:hypothetical protein